MPKNLRYFHIMYDGKTVKEINEKKYLAFAKHRERFIVGWIDETELYITSATVLSQSLLQKILEIGKWELPLG